MDITQITQIIALTMGVAWASGINLYAAVFMLGLMASTGHIELPPGLEILADPLVLFAAGVMYLIEFFADKIPGVDNGWDTLHTFIRIPAGAILAAGAVGEVSPAATLAAGLVGGAVTATVHVAKAGGRVLVNTSPEPVSNWLVSLGEDLTVIAGLWTALHYPLAFLLALALFLALVAWALPRIWRGLGQLAHRIKGLFRPRPPAAEPPATQPPRPLAPPPRKLK